MIKIIPYVIAFILAPVISAILSYFAGIIYAWPNIVFKMPLNFWFGISIGGIESFIIVWRYAPNKITNIKSHIVFKFLVLIF